MIQVLVNVAALAEVQREADAGNVEAVHRKLDDLMLSPSIVTVCAWCSDAASKVKAAHAAGHVVSHGICAACAKLADPRD